MISRQRINHILYSLVVILLLIFATWVIYFITTRSSRLDFRVFYGAATAAMHSKSIYSLYGIYMMPFWYFPWSAWLYIPFTFLTFSAAWYSYVIVCCIFLWVMLTYYVERFHVSEKTLDKIFIYSMSLLLSMMLFNFGQTDIVVLGIATLLVWSLENKRQYLAGAILPISLIKPHLLIAFVFACLLKGGKKTFLAASLSSLSMFAIEFFLDPLWLNKFFSLFVYGSKRNEKLYWGHTTLPSLLGFQENYVGTANLPITILLILIGLLVVWKYREVTASRLIALSLAASLFCAPRAFGYDIVLLFPAMWMLSENFDWKTFCFWGIAVTIAFAYNFSTNTYILTLLVFAMSIGKLRAEVWYQYGKTHVQSKA